MSKTRKNNRFLYYCTNIAGCLLPRFVYQRRLDKKISSYKKKHPEEWDYITERVDYYCKLAKKQEVTENALQLKHFKFPKFRSKKEQAPLGNNHNTTYFFDAYRYTKYLPDHTTMQFCFGDVTYIPEQPAIVKSRPVGDSNQNSVLLNLDKVRHFMFVDDSIPFEQKINMLVGRGYICQEHRIRFYKMYFGHPLCDLGQTNKKPMFDKRWITPRMSIAEHLNYKFVMCLQGNDVATNLKWVMSSNSIAVMPRPTFETWYMEGRLKPNVHYIEIKPNYSDLEEKLNYYIEHTNEALAIIDNAHQWVKQFSNKKREDIISLMVVKKYKQMTNLD